MNADYKILLDACVPANYGVCDLNWLGLRMQLQTYGGFLS